MLNLIDKKILTILCQNYLFIWRPDWNNIAYIIHSETSNLGQHSLRRFIIQWYIKNINAMQKMKYAFDSLTILLASGIFCCLLITFANCLTI